MLKKILMITLLVGVCSLTSSVGFCCHNAKNINNQNIQQEANKFNPYTDGIPSNLSICKIIEDKNGNMWVASFTNGVYEKLSSSDTFTKFTSGLPTSLYINCIYGDNDGNIWIGTNTHGVWEKTETGNDFTQITSGLASNYTIYCVFADKDNNIFVGTNSNDGLWEQKSGSGNFTKETIGSIDHVDVNSIFQDKHGYLWVGTGEGLYISTSNGNNSLSTGAIVGIVVGVLAASGIIGGSIYYFYFLKNKK